MAKPKTSPAKPAPAPAPTPVAPPAAAPPAKPGKKAKRSRSRILTVAAAAVVLAGVVGYGKLHRPAIKAVEPEPPKVVASDTVQPLSVAVLPFTDSTGDLSLAYVADGLTVSLTSDLHRIPGAYVLNAANAYAYNAKPLTLPRLGKDLGVRFVVQGTVSRDGDEFRVKAELGDTLTNVELWSQNFAGDAAELFAIQDRITTQVGNIIGGASIVIMPRDDETSEGGPKAAESILRAKALTLQPQSLKTYRQIESLYRQALAIDPKNVSAMAILADYLVVEPVNFGSELAPAQREAKYSEGRELALKAKDIDPNDPSIYDALGGYALRHDDLAGAEQALEKALSLDPKNPGAYNDLAYAYILAGDAKKAIDLLTQANRLDASHPLDVVAVNMGFAHLTLGANAAAIEWLLKAQQINPASPDSFALLALAYSLQGDDVKAHDAVTELHKLSANYQLQDIGEPGPKSPDAYKQFWEGKLLPAAHKSGLLS